MSGPCTDCGGPDYQTLVARIAELEALSNTSICIFCGTTMDKDLHVMLDHAKGCEKRPENNLLKRAEQAEAALAQRDELRCTSCDDEAECSILTAVCEHSDWEIEDGYQFGCRLHTDLRARAEEGSEE